MDILLISSIISLLSLDTTIAFQMLISSPIFTGPFIGWLMGDVQLGFELGALFQLLWLGKIPAGAASTPEGNLATMAVIALIISQQNLNLPNTTIAIFFIEGILLSYLGALLTIFYRKLNGSILKLLLQRMQYLKINLLRFSGIFSMLLFMGIAFLFLVAVFKINQIYAPGIIHMIGSLFEKVLIVVEPAIWGLGIYAVLPLIKIPNLTKQGKDD